MTLVWGRREVFRGLLVLVLVLAGITYVSEERYRRNLHELEMELARLSTSLEPVVTVTASWGETFSWQGERYYPTFRMLALVEPDHWADHLDHLGWGPDGTPLYRAREGNPTEVLIPLGKGVFAIYARKVGD